MLLVLGNEARRQAVRYGRTEIRPVDLLLAVPALDRGMTVAGLSLPENLLAVNSAARTLRSAGVRQVDLVRAATAAAAADAPAEPTIPIDMERSADTDKLLATIRLLAAERKDESVGTSHVLSVLLTDPDGPASQLLRETGADPADVRARAEAALETRHGA